MSPAEGFGPGILPVFRVACSVVTIAAGVAGSVMLVAPQDTDSYFSWPIGPPPLAATVGAFYLVSAGLFAVLGLRADWSAAQGVCVAVLAFTVPTVVATAHHDDLFDWGRWQALAWAVVFAATPVIFSALLFIQRGRATITGPALPGLTRVVLGSLGVAYALLALGFLFAPAELEQRSPYGLPGLSGRFMGSWCAFLAVLAGFALSRNRARQAAVPLVALMLWPMAAVVGALRSFDDLQPSARRLAYLFVLAGLATLAGLSLGTNRRVAGRPPTNASRNAISSSGESGGRTWTK
ncbi:MAG TPA: hypothetical protein VHF00_02195 [Acidimicrobiales bacterium]|nr:hypothetical protein [Acidimicrobiales bacterium]